MCSAPAFHAQAADRSTCRVHNPKGARLHTNGHLWVPQNGISILMTKIVEDRYFISVRLSASLHGLSRNTFISYLHYNILHSEYMQKNIVRTTDIKAAGTCPNNRFDKKHLSVRFLKPESSSGLISILVDSCSCKSWQVMDHFFLPQFKSRLTSSGFLQLLNFSNFPPFS